ncbi:MAG: N-acetylmuramoyl-L-alanine amidase family protein, partial [Verrucomicrobiales bacterium]
TIPDRGIRRARYSVLTGVKHPAVLLEGGFMSHPTESQIIKTDKFQKTYAEAIARSILFYRKATCANNKAVAR